MIYNPQRIQDDLVQDTVILTRLLTPRISLENLASVIKRRRLRRVFAGLGPKLTAASSPILTHIWPPKLQYLSASQFVKYLFPQSA